MTRDHRPSALELQLKAIVHRHPDAVVHPHSPSGPPIRTVMWNAFIDGQIDDQILGQAFWCTDTNRWVVRAADLTVGESSVVTEHPHDFDHLASAITRVIDAVRNPDPLDVLPPDLAGVLRSLRDGV
ncbi:hypothetical protein GCM10007147_18530 [Nocardiopsis kunsanensis]|uniref:Uncharacterized protein n=1 Tax=Nocardiopsis kunsanensis TaxID=141693 RepID=A0A918XBC8_9ACTN|nr:hypothetical protein [Nocardiopsis kunsanensis]GHD23378.1 hypothetical protein GCM10007147_18530 [Nocardiopsis kunsanensis]